MKVRFVLAIALCVFVSFFENAFSQTVTNKGSAANCFTSLDNVWNRSGSGARSGNAPRIGVADLPLLPGSDQQHIAGAVKLWAVRADASGKETSGPVSILHEKWQPNDYLYFYVATPSPLVVSLYQLYPLTGFPGQNESRVVLPDDKYPISFDPVDVGLAVRMPLLMKMDNTRVDEEIAFSFLTMGIDDPKGILNIGNPTLDNPPTLPKQGGGIGGQGGSMSFRDQMRNYADGAGKVALKSDIPSSARIVIAGDGGKASSSNTDDVAVTLIFCGKIAFVKLTMHKD